MVKVRVCVLTGVSVNQVPVQVAVGVLVAVKVLVGVAVKELVKVGVQILKAGAAPMKTSARVKPKEWMVLIGITIRIGPFGQIRRLRNILTAMSDFNPFN